MPVCATFPRSAAMNTLCDGLRAHLTGWTNGGMNGSEREKYTPGKIDSRKARSIRRSQIDRRAAVVETGGRRLH